MKKIYLFGAGGVGREVAEILYRQKLYREVCFIDDVVKDEFINGFKIFRSQEILNNNFSDCAAITVGEPRSRKKLYEVLSGYGIKPENVFASSVKISDKAFVDDGTIVQEDVVINTSAKIGKGCYINKKAVIPHDVAIGDFCVVGVGVVIGGNTVIGHNTYIGNGAVIREGTIIGDNCIIGMGSVIVKNVESENVVVGNPGRILRKNIDGKIFK